MEANSIEKRIEMRVGAKHVSELLDEALINAYFPD